MTPDIGGKSVAGNPADSGAHNLNSDHQWIRENHCPKHAETKLGTGLGIRRNSAWVIVSGAGNQSRT